MVMASGDTAADGSIMRWEKLGHVERKEREKMEIFLGERLKRRRVVAGL